VFRSVSSDASAEHIIEKRKKHTPKNLKAIIRTKQIPIRERKKQLKKQKEQKTTPKRKTPINQITNSKH